MSNKRIKIEAEDGGVQSMLKRLKDSAKELGDELISVSMLSKKGGKDSLDLLESQIKSIERRIKLDASSQKYVAERTYKHNLTRARTSESQAQIKESYADRLSQIKAEQKTDKMQISLLRELIDAVKSTARDELRSDKASAEKQLQRYEVGKLSGASLLDQLKFETQRSDLGRDQDDEPEEKKTWKDVAKGIIAAQSLNYIASKVGMVTQVLATAKDEDQVVSKMWAGIPIIGEGLSSASERHIESSEQRGKLAGRLMGISGRGHAPDTIRGLLEEEHYVSIARESIKKRKRLDETLEDLAEERGIDRGDVKGGMFPSWKEALGSFGGYDDEQQAYLKALRDKRDIERDKIADESARKKKSIRDEFKAKEIAYNKAWSYEGLGYDQNELLPIAGNLARASGVSSHLSSRTKDYVAMMKARGLSEGTISSLAGLLRYDTGGKLIGKVGAMENLFSGAGIGRARFEESLGIVNQISQSRMGRGIEHTDMVGMAQIKSAFEQAGGSFANSSGTINSIDSALSTPSSDFQESLNFKIYSQEMAKQGKPATYLGFKKWQEQGIGAKGLLSGRAKWIKNTFGNTEMGQIAYKNLFGLKSYEQSESMFGINPNDFDVVDSSQVSTSQNYHGDAKYNTTRREESQAEISDAFISSMEVGLQKVFTKVGSAIAEKIMSADLPFAEDMGSALLDWMEGME